MTALLGRQGPPSDLHRDGCGPTWALLCALTFLVVAVVIRVVWEVFG